MLSRLGLAGGMEPLSASLIRLTGSGVGRHLGHRLLRGAARQATSPLRQHPRAGLRLTGGAIAGPVIGVWRYRWSPCSARRSASPPLTSLTPIFLIPISYVAEARHPAGGRRLPLIAFAGHGAAVPVKIRRSRV
ncbi:MAG: hypothetical protein U0703_27670 [Anaerolineae bacterium]